MKAASRIFVTLFLLIAFLSNALPCGPGYVTPLFDTTGAPEEPYIDYAAGRLGIVKPTYSRSVLYAAYRYIAGNGMSKAEQDELVAVWRAEIDNKDFPDDSIGEALKQWVDRRKEVVGKEEKVPDIYAERAYGGYDFFPNCSKNAFETAAATLADRASAHGPSDVSVRDWVKAQDQVFENCSSGKQTPEQPAPGAPDWLVKDRAYQIAAASFYSLDYEDAKKRFGQIAQDTESPWAETSDYLVARTLIRQASLAKSKEKADAYYDEAEIHLQRFVSRTGKFTASSEKLQNLVKFRRHPKERLAELARNLAGRGSDNFRQDVIDYNWLLDKFASETLAAEDKRKAEIEALKNKEPNPNPPSADPSPAPTPTNDDLELYLYANETSYKFYIKPDASDDDAILAAERSVGKPLTDDQKKQVRSLRQSAYAGRFTADRQSGYEGGYYGDTAMTPSLLPDFLRQNEMTEWLFTYQMTGAEAYLYSLNKYKATGSELWLMTAISKAEKSSTGLPKLIEAAQNSSTSSAAYPTIAYHTARILLAQGKSAEAREIIDRMIAAGDQLPLSARNSFIALRLTLAESLEDFLKYSLKKPYAFDFSGDVGTIDDLIAREKTYYDPEYNKDGREAYNAEVEARYKTEREWQERATFDDDTIDVFNQHFPTASLLDVERSPALPDYMRERFVMAVWMRSFLIDNMATMLTVTPELAKYHPEFAPQLEKITSAKTQAAMDNAALYFVLKNPILSPYLESGIGRTDNEQDQWAPDDWWCAPYDTEYNDKTNSEQPKTLPRRPPFITAAQSKLAQTERTRLKEIGDAPKFFGDKVKTWARLAPADRRVPEALYIVIEANGWTKYGCGNDEDLKNELTAILKKRYPNSEWTAKLRAEEEEQNK